MPASSLTGVVSPSDVEGLAGERFAVYAHHSEELRTMKRDERWSLTLAPLQCEIFTVALIRNEIPTIGLMNMFNSSGTIQRKWAEKDGSYPITL